MLNQLLTNATEWARNGRDVRVLLSDDMKWYQLTGARQGDTVKVKGDQGEFCVAVSTIYNMVVMEDSSPPQAVEARSADQAASWIGGGVLAGVILAIAFIVYGCAVQDNGRTSSVATWMPGIQSPAVGAGHPTAENGSYYGQLSNKTLRPKTVHVDSYTQRDGTHVRSHYRSSPR